MTIGTYDFHRESQFYSEFRNIIAVLKFDSLKIQGFEIRKEIQGMTESLIPELTTSSGMDPGHD